MASRHKRTPEEYVAGQNEAYDHALGDDNPHSVSSQARSTLIRQTAARARRDVSEPDDKTFVALGFDYGYNLGSTHTIQDLSEAIGVESSTLEDIRSDHKPTAYESASATLRSLTAFVTRLEADLGAPGRESNG